MVAPTWPTERVGCYDPKDPKDPQGRTNTAANSQP